MHFHWQHTLCQDIIRQLAKSFKCSQTPFAPCAALGWWGFAYMFHFTTCYCFRQLQRPYPVGVWCLQVHTNPSCLCACVWMCTWHLNCSCQSNISAERMAHRKMNAGRQYQYQCQLLINPLPKVTCLYMLYMQVLYEYIYIAYRVRVALPRTSRLPHAPGINCSCKL